VILCRLLEISNTTVRGGWALLFRLFSDYLRRMRDACAALTKHKHVNQIVLAVSIGDKDLGNDIYQSRGQCLVMMICFWPVVYLEIHRVLMRQHLASGFEYAKPRTEMTLG
jgi:hypothetical protein